MPLIRTIANRLLTTLVTLLGVAVIVFVVIRVVPGNPIAMMLPPGASDADIARVDAEHRALLAALTAGDADEAGRLARQHVERTATIVARSLGLEPRVSR